MNGCILETWEPILAQLRPPSMDSINHANIILFLKAAGMSKLSKSNINLTKLLHTPHLGTPFVDTASFSAFLGGAFLDVFLGKDY